VSETSPLAHPPASDVEHVNLTRKTPLLF
jgi:hypothetical protein